MNKWDIQQFRNDIGQAKKNLGIREMAQVISFKMEYEELGLLILELQDELKKKELSTEIP